MSDTSRIIPVGQEPPAMLSAEERQRRAERASERESQTAKPKRSAWGGARAKAAGRFRVLNAFVDSTLRGLRRNDAAVWLVLYRDTGPEGTANVSQGRIAERAGITARTVRRAVTRLAQRGLLTVVYRGSLRRGPTLYRVWPQPKERDHGRRLGDKLLSGSCGQSDTVTGDKLLSASTESTNAAVRWTRLPPDMEQGT